MKKNTLLHKVFILVLVLVVVTSCTRPHPQTFAQAHYEFKEDDYEKILDYNLDEVIKYRSNTGLEVTYKPDFVTDIEKAQYTSDGGGVYFLFFHIPYPGEGYFFYYDIKSLSYNNASLQYGFVRFPDDLFQAQKNAYKEYDSSFILQIKFERWIDNKVIEIDFDETTTEMLIDGVTYDKVYTIESESTSPICNFFSVNKLYYDLTAGIIGYDEIDGTQWRLVN